MPPDILTTEHRVLLLDHLSEYKSMIRTLSKVLEENPGHAVALNNRGLAQFEIGECDSALQDFERAIQAGHRSAVPYMNRGDLLQKLGRFDEAIKDYGQAIDLQPLNPSFRRSRAHLLVQMGRLLESLQDFSVAIEIEPSFKQTLLDQAAVYEALGVKSPAASDQAAADTAGLTTCELYETDSVVVAFLSEGLLRFHPSSGWTFSPVGSVLWDSFHQGVYRNHKANRLTSADLERRGIPPPPADQYRGAPAVAWKDQFNAEIPLSAVPPGILDRLKADGSRERSVYLVLYEDVYETAFGDGCFWYPQAAFWTENDARIFLRFRLTKESERPKNEVGYKYCLKEIRLRADESGQKLAAELYIETYEHYSIEDVVRLLAAKPENPV
jgi:hypothetical protein